MIVEISKYLTLNDAVKAFSLDFVQEIKTESFPVHISNESELFIPLLAGPFDWKQVRTLRLNLDGIESIAHSYTCPSVRAVQSLHLLNIRRTDQISEACRIFVPMKHLSLWFNDEFLVDEVFQRVFSLASSNIDVEIHCPGVRCRHTRTGRLCDLFFMNRSTTVIKSLLFDFGHSPLPSAHDCKEHRDKCCLTWITSRISQMPNLQAIRFRLDSFNVKKLLFTDLWRATLERCRSLHRVIIYLSNDPPNEAMLRRAATIENNVKSTRPNFRFRIKFF